ncbi:nose resistant to fluoxetine protein 6-like [Uloborus diversus]|uniref:nose resistant to fluoxetine protein 6-like n=1 Tax=Uloborus diversus TaxID=327109 RepID=UPI00240A39F6|nr:nose resistant to fluoxetine protein 6-like [Uloborus diversus]
MEATGTGFEAQVMHCEQKEDIILSASDIAVITVLCILVSLGITATIVDVFSELTSDSERNSKDKSVLTQCLLCFSFYTNTKRLLKKDDSKDSIKIFHGMKVITVLWVILNHSYYYTNIQVAGSLITVTDWRQKIAFQLMANGFLNVETFFFITAVLIAYGVTRMPGKQINIGLYIVRRIWRLTPPFMLVIATSFLVPYFGSGPVWHETVVEGIINKCKKNWWKNLLYFNNFVPVKETCFPWMWYLPADTHLYIIALVFLIPLKRNVNLAFLMNGVLLAAGTCATIFNNYYYQLHPTAITAFTHPEDGNYFADYGYFRSYLHLSTYCVGMTVGYVIATRKKIHIPLVVNILGWLVSSVAALTVLYGVYEWNQGNVPSLVVSTLYTCTNKFVWSLALGWVTVVCMTGNGGIVTRILSWQAFVPLSRLTYMAYLVHPIIQFMYVGSTRVLIRADHRTFVFMYLGYVLTGFMSAFVLSLLFESPFMALEKVFLAPKKKTDEKELPKSVESTQKPWKAINLNHKSRVYSVSGSQNAAMENGVH